jgi:hypothetical protein
MIAFGVLSDRRLSILQEVRSIEVLMVSNST